MNIPTYENNEDIKRMIDDLKRKGEDFIRKYNKKYKNYRDE